MEWGTSRLLGALLFLSASTAGAVGFTINSGTISFTTGRGISTTGDVRIQGGNLVVNNSTITLGGNWVYSSGSFNAGNGGVVFNATVPGRTITTGGRAYNNVQMNGVGGGWTLQDAVTLASLAINAGTLDANPVGNHPIAVSRSWSNGGGAFVPRLSTVSFTGSAVTISGQTTFSGFSSTVPGQAMTFTAGSTQTVTGRFRLQGSVLNPIVIRSSNLGQYAYLINSGTNTVRYVDVRDNNAGSDPSGIPIFAAASIDSTNNVNWFFGAPGVGTPKRPAGVLGTLMSSGTQFVFTWKRVTKDVSNNPIPVDSYEVYRGTNLTDLTSYSLVATVPTGSPLEFNDARVPGVTQYYFVRANAGGILSTESDVVDNTDDTNRYIWDNADRENRWVIPRPSALELLSENNIFNFDLEMIPFRQTAMEVGNVLRSYLFRFMDADSGQQVPTFSFSQALSTVRISFASGSPSPAANDQIAMYWNNGSNWLRLNNPVAGNVQNWMDVLAQNQGTYQIRVVTPSSSFRLQDGSPYPRVITPKDPTQNNRVFFFYENPTNASVEGEIYDLRGGRVRSLNPSSSPMIWDGRDGGNNVVPGGIYIYKITCEGQTLTGTVVVVR